MSDDIEMELFKRDIKIIGKCMLSYGGWVVAIVLAIKLLGGDV